MAVVKFITPTSRFLICECGWTTMHAGADLTGRTLSEITAAHARLCDQFETLEQHCTGLGGLRDRVMLVWYAGRAKILWQLPDGEL